MSLLIESSAGLSNDWYNLLHEISYEESQWSQLYIKGHHVLLAVDYYDYMSNSVVYLPWAL